MPPHRTRTPLLVGGSMLLGAGLAIVGLIAGGLVDQPPATEVIERIEQPRSVSAVDPGAFEAALDAEVLPAVARLEARTPRGRRTASAVVFRSDGHLLTTHDAVAGATDLTVTTTDGLVLDAELVGTDPVTDLAVVKVDADGLPTVLLGSVRDLQLGEPVFAIDAAGGATGTPAVSGGVISGLGDRVEVDGAAPLDDMIASNTGGQVATPGAALIDSSGALIGIATARRPAGPLPVGSGAAITRYATPVSYARAIAGELMAKGTVAHVWLGIEGNGEPGLAPTRASGRTDGARVGSVARQSPAEAAGIVAGDVISAVDDTRVTDLNSLVVTLRDHATGDVVRLTVERDGERRVVEVTLGERPPFP